MEEEKKRKSGNRSAPPVSWPNPRRGKKSGQTEGTEEGKKLCIQESPTPTLHPPPHSRRNYLQQEQQQPTPGHCGHKGSTSLAKRREDPPISPPPHFLFKPSLTLQQDTHKKRLLVTSLQTVCLTLPSLFSASPLISAATLNEWASFIPRGKERERERRKEKILAPEVSHLLLLLLLLHLLPLRGVMISNPSISPAAASLFSSPLPSSCVSNGESTSFLSSASLSRNCSCFFFFVKNFLTSFALKEPFRINHNASIMFCAYTNLQFSWHSLFLIFADGNQCPPLPKNSLLMVLPFLYVGGGKSATITCTVLFCSSSSSSSSSIARTFDPGITKHRRNFGRYHHEQIWDKNELQAWIHCTEKKVLKNIFCGFD